MTFRQRLQRFSYQYQRFVEKQGFPILMTVCVAVIVLSAVWSGRMDQTIPMPTPPVDHAQSAARLEQESLQNAATPAPEPTATPCIWHKPLDAMIVQRGFNASRLEQDQRTGLWQTHAGTDLQAAYGDKVMAIADGKVESCTESGIWGTSVTIQHGEEYSAIYGNLAQTAGLQAGDPVEAGQTIGFAGNTMITEAAQEPHIHLIVLRDGSPIDPVSLFP